MGSARSLWVDDVTAIPIGTNAYKRSRADEPEIFVKNRFFESSPANQIDQIALIVRPSLTRRTAVGVGPIRAVYSQPGAFDDDLFVVSADALYRVHKAFGMADTVEQVTGTIAGDDAPEMVATATYLFITDATLLQYTDDSNVLATIAVPDSIPMRSLGSIAGYILCSQVSKQRFYWIEPGEVTIDALNFAEAERGPDPIENIRIIGDQIWLFGSATTEVWYATGDPLAPFQRTQGRLFDRGVWQGTAVAINDQTLLVGADSIVYSVTGQPTQVSTTGIEQRIREAMRLQEND